MSKRQFKRHDIVTSKRLASMLKSAGLNPLHVARAYFGSYDKPINSLSELSQPQRIRLLGRVAS